MENAEKRIKIDDRELTRAFSYQEGFLKLFDARFSSIITLRGDSVIVKGESSEVKLIETIFKELSYILDRTGELSVQDANSVIDLLDDRSIGESAKRGETNGAIFYGVKEPIKPKTKKQKEYWEKVAESDLTFAIGPAGTGKTFLAVAMALSALKSNKVGKLVISRPAVEAGESLGFLPGDLSEKLDPYLKPITDALYYMIGPDKFRSMLDKSVIEITPLAYMRGRTLNDCFIILDEAQNATISQMKMFLTRLGSNSKAIVTGDITQIDLKNKNFSGLAHAEKILRNIKGISFVYFDVSDALRHKLVSKIIRAYESDNQTEE